MTFHEVEAIIARISYRPGWTLEAELREDLVLSRVKVSIHDVRDQAMVLNLTMWTEQTLASLRNEASVVLWAWDKFQEMERHEAREWFRLDNQTVLDPHGKP